MPKVLLPNIPPSSPFLKWPGGKTRILKELTPYITRNSILVEPFVGGGSVFLNFSFREYLLNDINQDLINLFNLIKTKKNIFIKEARKLFHPKTNCAAFYYQCRTQFNGSVHPFERSILFLYLNKHGFNGLCRYNLKGAYNVPFGSYQQVSFPQMAIEQFAEKSQYARFSNLPFAEFLGALPKQYGRKKLTIYCDPPYVPLSATANFTGYAAQKFTLTDQERLASLALELSKHSATVIISNHDTDFTRELYKKATIIPLQVQRAISCKSHSRTKVNELLAIYHQGT